MSHGGYYIPRLFRFIPRNLEGLTILDCGSGLGEVAYYIHAFTGRPACDFNGRPIITGIDINQQSVDWTRRFLTPRIYEDVHHLDLLDLEKWASGRRWDMALLLEVPEHIPKDKMLRILDQVERVCDYILIATPYGDELNRDYGDVIPEFNHVSVWMPSDFERRGYQVWVEEVTPMPMQIHPLLLRINALYRRLRGRKSIVQRKIIAVRNPKGLEVSGGIDFAGLRGKV